MHRSHGLQHLRHKRPTFAFADESGYTLGFQRRIAHSGSHGETRALPPSATARSCAASEIATIRTAGGSGCTPMACVRFLQRRGPAGLRDLFRFCRNRDLYIRRSWFSACARQGRYHYPRCAPRAAETPDGRLSKRLICRFLRSGGRSSPHDSYFLANTQNFLLAVPVANAFALWYDKFDKLELSN